MPKCKSCGAEIEWWTTTDGKKMPVDVSPAPYWCPMPGATVVLKVAGRQAIVVKVPTDRPMAEVRLSHFATCPQGAQWSKKGGK